MPPEKTSARKKKLMIMCVQQIIMKVAPYAINRLNLLSSNQVQLVFLIEKIQNNFFRHMFFFRYLNPDLNGLNRRSDLTPCEIFPNSQNFSEKKLTLRHSKKKLKKRSSNNSQSEMPPEKTSARKKKLMIMCVQQIIMKVAPYAINRLNLLSSNQVQLVFLIEKIQNNFFRHMFFFSISESRP